MKRRSVTVLEGDIFNDVRFVSSSTAEPYVINSLDWSGLVNPFEEPPGELPTFARDLSVRITHESSAVAELQLGQGGLFDPEEAFSGFEFSQLHGTLVSPGDTLDFEFYTDFGGFTGIDAEWINITFNLNPLSGGVAPPAFEPGMIRADATGITSYGTNLRAFPDADNFFGISYGVPTSLAAGSGGGESLSITEVEVRLSDDGSVWWDSVSALSPAVIGDDSVGILEDLEALGENAILAFSEPGAQVADSFAVATFTLPPDVFTEGDVLQRFGFDFDAFGFDVDGSRIGQVQSGVGGTFGGEIPGAEFANLSALSQSPIITVTFEDGSQVQGTLDQLGTGQGPGGFFSFSNLEPLDQFDPADFNKDGLVDGDDFLIWQTGFGTETGATQADGDADGDGAVDGNDFLIWQTGFGSGVPGSGAAAIPEPAAGLLALVAALCAWFARRGR